MSRVDALPSRILFLLRVKGALSINSVFTGIPLKIYKR